MTIDDDHVAQSNAHTAHHEAGHAVGVIVTGGTLIGLWFNDRDMTDAAASLNGLTRHVPTSAGLAFVTYAGIWAGARWAFENDPEIDDIDEAILFEWGDGDAGDEMGDLAIYEREVAVAHSAANPPGSVHPVRPWEWRWDALLDELWTAICDVAAVMLADGDVAPEMVGHLVECLGLEDFGDTTTTL